MTTQSYTSFLYQLRWGGVLYTTILQDVKNNENCKKLPLNKGGSVQVYGVDQTLNVELLKLVNETS